MRGKLMEHSMATSQLGWGRRACGGVRKKRRGTFVGNQGHEKEVRGDGVRGKRQVLYDWGGWWWHGGRRQENKVVTHNEAEHEIAYRAEKLPNLTCEHLRCLVTNPRAKSEVQVSLKVSLVNHGSQFIPLTLIIDYKFADSSTPMGLSLQQATIALEFGPLEKREKTSQITDCGNEKAGQGVARNEHYLSFPQFYTSCTFEMPAEDIIFNDDDLQQPNPGWNSSEWIGCGWIYRDVPEYVALEAMRARQIPAAFTSTLPSELLSPAGFYTGRERVI
ncbi:hypothetical protein B0H11DRAFT_2315849 [Mycena galericulata]|nr:hypothetical protein B0H11DRAFT_2315849 [Mycena galericulata]